MTHPLATQVEAPTEMVDEMLTWSGVDDTLKNVFEFRI